MTMNYIIEKRAYDSCMFGWEKKYGSPKRYRVSEPSTITLASAISNANISLTGARRIPPNWAYSCKSVKDQLEISLKRSHSLKHFKHVFPATREIRGMIYLHQKLYKKKLNMVEM